MLNARTDGVKREKLMVCGGAVEELRDETIKKGLDADSVMVNPRRMFLANEFPECRTGEWGTSWLRSIVPELRDLSGHDI
jgi:hypothetical protein